MNLHQLPERTCLWCHTPFEGRADKKFCKNACKASHSRNLLAADSPDAAPLASRSSTATRPQSTVVVDWQTRCEQPEQALHTQEQVALPFEQEYTRLEQLLRQYYLPGCSLSMLAYLLLQVEQGLEKYKQHPALSNPQHAAQYRLGHLYSTRQCLQAEHRFLLLNCKKDIENVRGRL